MTVTENTAASNPDSEDFSLDAILVRVGQIGKFQIINYLFLCIPMLLTAINNLSYVFTASSVIYRCRVPECDGPESVYKELWTEFTIPTAFNGILENCNRYVPFNRSSELDLCHADNYNQQATEKCGTDLIFRDKEVSISNDFGIFCGDEWKLSMVGTISNSGQFFGISIGGYFADKYGRRTTLAIAGFLGAIMGIIRSFAIDYYTFLLFEFLDNVCTCIIYGLIFVLSLELVGPKARVLACSVITTFYCFGEVILGVVAKYSPNWRITIRIFYIPALAHIALLWILPESIRWLLSQGEEEKAKKILKKLATVNKRKLSDHSIEKLVLANKYKLANSDERKFPIKEAFKLFFWRIANCSVCWFTHVLVYYGLSLNAVFLGGNKYDNFIFLSLVEIPGLFVPYFTMKWLGRRYLLFGLLVICGICIGITIFIRSDFFVLQMTLFLIGKLAISASFQVTYFFTSEMFPTKMRSSLLSVCSMFGRIGSIIAPLTPLMGKYYQQAPAILFTSFALMSACMALFFPETSDVTLPATMSEAEKIGRNGQQ